MTTEVWLRNPHDYIREVVEVRHDLIAFDRGIVIKRNFDPSKFVELHMDPTVEYRMLVIGHNGAQELRRGYDIFRPYAVYPVWQYGDDLEMLLEMIENPAGDDPAACSDKKVPSRYRPRRGQEHRVVVTAVPSLSTGPGRKMVRVLSDLQEEYPEVKIHIHGLYSYRAMFGMSFTSVDVDARTTAKKGKVYLPNGKEVTYELAAKSPQWVRLCGFLPRELEVPRNRCMYNIKSALWAAEFYKQNVKFKTVQPRNAEVDFKSPSSEVKLSETSSHLTKDVKPSDGDKFLCDLCSIRDSCKYFRRGAVCSVPGTEPAKFADQFKTRDADQIVDALGTLLASQAGRLEEGMRDEEIKGELDPEVTKIANHLFGNGRKLAMLLNPALAGGPKVGIMVQGGGAASVTVGSSAGQLTAAIVAELEAKGIPREEITPAMVAQVLDPNSRERAAIETTATAIARDDG